MNSKAKGSQYERDVCRKFSLWISDGKNPNLLWRSAMSGGRSTVMNKKGGVNKEQAGDISAVGAEGHRLIDIAYLECKNYTDLGLNSFFIGRSSKLLSFWRDTEKAARKNAKYPLLIAKQSYFPELIVFSPEFYLELLDCKPFNRTVIMTREEIIEVGLLDEFLEAFIIKPAGKGE